MCFLVAMSQRMLSAVDSLCNTSLVSCGGFLFWNTVRLSKIQCCQWSSSPVKGHSQYTSAVDPNGYNALVTHLRWILKGTVHLLLASGTQLQWTRLFRVQCTCNNQSLWENRLAQFSMLFWNKRHVIIRCSFKRRHHQYSGIVPWRLTVGTNSLSPAYKKEEESSGRQETDLEKFYYEDRKLPYRDHWAAVQRPLVWFSGCWLNS